MKILIFIGMLIVFISAFFIFFIFDVVMKENISCLNQKENLECNTSHAVRSVMIGLGFIGGFIIVDGIVIYLIMKHLTASTGYV